MDQKNQYEFTNFSDVLISNPEVGIELLQKKSTLPEHIILAVVEAFSTPENAIDILSSSEDNDLRTCGHILAWAKRNSDNRKERLAARGKK